MKNRIAAAGGAFLMLLALSMTPASPTSEPASAVQARNCAYC